jgi:hypothetical protein
VIREDHFLISRKPFAVDLSTVTGEQHPRGDLFAFRGTANALWFRRRKGVTVSCIGTVMLWSHYLAAPVDLDDPHAMLSADLDGRYGGDTHGRWDGAGYWGNVTLEQQEQHLAVLRPMLSNHPDIPDGYDGWWTFQKSAQR